MVQLPERKVGLEVPWIGGGKVLRLARLTIDKIDNRGDKRTFGYWQETLGCLGHPLLEWRAGPGDKVATRASHPHPEIVLMSQKLRSGLNK